MRLEWSLLCFEPGRDTSSLYVRRKTPCSLDTGAHAQPRHPHEATPIERPEVTERKLERFQVGSGQSIGDACDEVALDATDEAHGQV
jgi:hypothetical protein